MNIATQERPFKNPYPTTDIIIEYELNKKFGIVLIERKNFPYGLALPGGFAEFGLSFEQNAIKESKEETGLEIILENPEHPLCVHSNPNRDPRAHIVSATYIAKGFGTLKAGDDAKKAFHYEISQVLNLVKNSPEKFAFNDHVRAINDYLNLRGYLK